MRVLKQIPEGWAELGEGWTLAPSENDENFAMALACCKGIYQKHLVKGVESISGSTLRGKAQSYSGRYKASGQSLLKRMKAAGVRVQRVRWNKRHILILGDLPEEALVPLPA
jgi:hypothetical protein